MDQYPTVGLIVKHGDRLAVAIALLPALGGIAFLLAGFHWLLAVSGVVASGVLFFIMKSYVELVRVIADMLLPK